MIWLVYRPRRDARSIRRASLLITTAVRARSIKGCGGFLARSAEFSNIWQTPRLERLAKMYVVPPMRSVILLTTTAVKALSIKGGDG